MKFHNLKEIFSISILKENFENRERIGFDKKYVYLILFFIALFNLDFSFRSTYIASSQVPLYHIIPFLFTFFWCTVFTFLAFLLRNKAKKVYMFIISIFFLLYYLIQSVYFNVFDKFFTIADVTLLKEGASFFDMSYIYIPEAVVVSFIISFILMIVAIKLIPEQEEHSMILNAFVIIFCSILYSSARFSFPMHVPVGMWTYYENIHNIYNDYSDTTKALLLSGTFEYTIRDMWLTYNPFKIFNDQTTINRLNTYFENVEENHKNNAMTGIFEGKNLIAVQLENIDHWMLTEETMPQLNALRNSGINFANHFATTFSTGKTFNTEFIVNTGMIPPTNKGAPSYIFSAHEYPFSLGNVFKNENYHVNSFHASNPSVYNRGEIHQNFGYEQYHNYILMGMDDPLLDSQMINGYDLMVKKKPFMDFIITMSAHGPFTSDNIACSTHLEEVKSYAEYDDENYQCGLAQAKETDVFVKGLIENLEADGLLEDTVLVFYTDHYAYSTVDEELELELKGTKDINMLSHVPFFIWSQDILQPIQMEEVTSSVDILPTLVNLFGIQVEDKYYIGQDVFDKGKNYAFFQDGSIYNGVEYYQPANELNEISDQMKELIAEANDRLNRSWDMLMTNYFSHIK